MFKIKHDGEQVGNPSLSTATYVQRPSDWISISQLIHGSRKRLGVILSLTRAVNICANGWIKRMNGKVLLGGVEGERSPGLITKWSATGCQLTNPLHFSWIQLYWYSTSQTQSCQSTSAKATGTMKNYAMKMLCKKSKRKKVSRLYS